MADISKITVNGKFVNLKDSQGREMLEGKQKKLTAGNGISISADGVISCSTSEPSLPVWKIKSIINSGCHSYSICFQNDTKLEYGEKFYVYHKDTSFYDVLTSSTGSEFKERTDEKIYMQVVNNAYEYSYIPVAKLEFIEDL